MKVAMINDCAFVGETLRRYFPQDIDSLHIKRTRSLWSKTFGIAYGILRTEADLYHVHYLLQDCYLATIFGKKPLIGHAHGSDLRSSLQHKIWRRVVQHNLKKCDTVLVSTPDVLGQAKSFRDDAEYLPNPIDREIFYPKHFRRRNKKLKVLIASDSNWKVKGTDVAIKALSRVKGYVEVSLIEGGLDFDKTLVLARSLDLPLSILPRRSHGTLNEYYWNADVVIDRFKLGSMGMISLEAIACGRPVLVYVSSEYPENRGFPLMDLRSEEEISEEVMNVSKELWEKEYAFIEKHHDPVLITARLVSIYRKLTEK